MNSARSKEIHFYLIQIKQVRGQYIDKNYAFLCMIYVRDYFTPICVQKAALRYIVV